MLCSATLLISNKYAVYKVAAPSFILFSQLMGTALVVKAFAAMGKIECDALEKQKVMKFMPVALIFLARIFSNMKSLQYANVETFIVFQLSTPLVVSIADYLFLGRKLPSPRSWGCLLALLLGAVAYANTDSAFHVKGYTFCAVWYFIFLYGSDLLETCEKYSEDEQLGEGVLFQLPRKSTIGVHFY